MTMGTVNLDWILLRGKKKYVQMKERENKTKTEQKKKERLFILEINKVILLIVKTWASIQRRGSLI